MESRIAQPIGETCFEEKTSRGAGSFAKGEKVAELTCLGAEKKDNTVF